MAGERFLGYRVGRDLEQLLGRYIRSTGRAALQRRVNAAVPFGFSLTAVQ
jgi:hypothetical protein